MALLLIDVINDLAFPEANQLLRFARPMARNLLRLKKRAKKAGVPVIYVNDNFGRWQSDFRRQVASGRGEKESASLRRAMRRGPLPQLGPNDLLALAR